MVSSLNMGRRGESHPLSYLDMSECSSLDDTGLQLVVLSCPNLTHLYLRKCLNISGIPEGIEYRGRTYLYRERQDDDIGANGVS